jgi:hypothetical protein
MGVEPVARTSTRPFMSLRHFVETRYGSGSFAALRRELAKRHGLELDLVLRPNGWYPTAAFVRGLELGHELFGPDDFYELFGEAAAEYEISIFNRFVLRFTSPGWLVERGADVWSRSHDSGRWIVEREKPLHLRATLEGFAIPSDGFCRGLIGWFRRACAMTGVRDVVIEHPFCRARGLTACVFDGRWR